MSEKLYGEVHRCILQIFVVLKLFSFESNGGAIKIDIYGSKVIEKIDINKDLIDPEDKDMLEDMLKIAINDAISKIEEEMEKAVSSATGGMNIPGLM